MGVVVQFDPVGWAARYPEFANVTADQSTAYFTEATLYFANDGSGPVNDMGQATLLLWMLTAHIAQLYAATTSASGVAQPASPLVGRISSANEGSVSVSTDMPAMPGSAAWFSQSKYGLSFWAATAPYRTMRYRPAPRPCFGGYGMGYGGFCGRGLVMASLRGGDRLTAALGAMSKSVTKAAEVDIGFLAGATYPDGISVPMVAAIQEFGAPARNIPPRPFFRNMIADKSGEWPEIVADLLKANDYDAEKTLTLAGEGISGQLKQAIVDFVGAPLSPKTVERKGSAKALVDTGHMLQSVDYSVK